MLNSKQIPSARHHQGLRERPPHPGPTTRTCGRLLSVRGCPDILAAERQARHLLRRCIIEQLIHAKIQAAAG